MEGKKEGNNSMPLQWQPSTKDDVSHSSGTVDISHVGHHVAAGARQTCGEGARPGLAAPVPKEQRLQELFTCGLPGGGEKFLLPMVAPAGVTCIHGTCDGIACLRTLG